MYEVVVLWIYEA